jgi:hypothetical protein
MPDSGLPAPWRRVTTYAVGGLEYVGYAEDLDLLLVLSSEGRSLYDCRDGTLLARDRAEHAVNTVKLTARAIGPLHNEPVRVAGLYGGGLPLTARDGWMLQVDHDYHRPEPNGRAYPNVSVYITDARSWKAGTYAVKALAARTFPCELRACGFSETGKSFVVATSCELTIFARD